MKTPQPSKPTPDSPKPTPAQGQDPVETIDSMIKSTQAPKPTLANVAPPGTQHVSSTAYNRANDLAEILAGIPIEISQTPASPGKYNDATISRMSYSQLRNVRRQTQHCIARLNQAIEMYHAMSLQGHSYYSHVPHQKAYAGVLAEQRLLMTVDMAIQARVLEGDTEERK